VSGHESEGTYGGSVNARRVAPGGVGPRGPVDDLDRTPASSDPPVPGAQWDEIHARWEHWDEDAQQWVVVGDAGDGVAPVDENPVGPVLARELLHADEVERDHIAVLDVDRAPPPSEAPPGAQWNEVAQRWERWDEATESWVEAAGG
jgi:hypothetical protein